MRLNLDCRTAVSDKSQVAISPKFTFRMPQKDREALEEMAKLYGATAGGFLADMVSAMCSAEPQRIKAFMGRLVSMTGEQLTMKFNAVVDDMMEPQKPAQKALKPQMRKKGASSRARPA